ncbi:MAG: phosphoribosylformylglycinamidine synthase subunit PurQ, partial [Lachnospiraceae bacterium]|nr:phosphoribosylformylglycinamidine synthase subunit PurQ [Lachnospiraceae bacterium]
AETMLEYAASENLEAVCVATVTEEKRLVLKWRGKEIVNISRAFLDTNGAHQEASAIVTMPSEDKSIYDFHGYKAHSVKAAEGKSLKEQWTNLMADLNSCSKKGLWEMFDSSIGASTVLMPYGGKYELTPIQTMVAKLPVLRGACDTVTMMSYGMDPFLTSWSPYHGAVYAVIDSVAKIVAAGGDYTKIRFTFQEFFEKLRDDAKRWGKPLAALLGAYEAQVSLGLPSIGGKDSMSGSFNEIDVPPTLCSFAVCVDKEKNIVSNEFKKAGNMLVLFRMACDEIDGEKGYGLPNYEEFKKTMAYIRSLNERGIIASANAITGSGAADVIAKAAFGNMLGAVVTPDYVKELFEANHGAILAEVSAAAVDEILASGIFAEVVGEVINVPEIRCGEAGTIALADLLNAWKGTLESVFPTKTTGAEKALEKAGISNPSMPLYNTKTILVAKNKVARPNVFIPVFPGTNCEYDLLRAFEKAGANVNTVVFRNRDAQDIKESVDAFEKAIKESQIIMFPGGFSAGDEPDGSAKFIASAFRNVKLTNAVNDLLKQRDGLVLGICNGFQAVIKLGLVPYGEICDQQQDSPTLTQNAIGRHISKSVYTKVVSNKSPWLKNCELGGVYTIPASHGEGRFVATGEWLKKLVENGQVATQYVDLNGNPSYDEDFNPNLSYMAIEGITDASGRVLGKMAHSERIGDGVAKNIFGQQDMRVFEAGVEYFK